MLPRASLDRLGGVTTLVLGDGLEREQDDERIRRLCKEAMRELATESDVKHRAVVIG